MLLGEPEGLISHGEGDGRLLLDVLHHSVFLTLESSVLEQNTMLCYMARIPVFVDRGKRCRISSLSAPLYTCLLLFT
jgi:hypothetical protein